MAVAGEYFLDRILAEKTENGFTTYLVKWQGYPWNEWSWEPDDCFNNDGTIEIWHRRRAREKSGELKPFDFKDFDRRLAAFIAGEDVEDPGEPEPNPPEISGIVEIEDDTASSSSDEEPLMGSSTAVARSNVQQTRPRANGGTAKDPAYRAPKPAIVRVSGSRTSQHPKNSGAAVLQKIKAVSKRPTPAPYSQFSLRSARKTKTINSLPLNSDVKERAQSSKDIFKSWADEPKERGHNQQPRLYKSLSGVWRAELQSRNERTPDLNVLSLYNPRHETPKDHDSTGRPRSKRHKVASDTERNSTAFETSLPETLGHTESRQPKSKQSADTEPTVIYEPSLDTLPRNNKSIIGNDLFLPQSPPHQAIQSPTGDQADPQQEMNDNVQDRSALKRRASIAADERPNRPTGVRSVIQEEYACAKPRLFGDATYGRARRMSVPEKAIESTRSHQDTFNSLVTDFERISGNVDLDNRKTEIYGTFVVGHHREIVAPVAYHGLAFYLKRLFLSIKKPPKDVTVSVTGTCSAPEYFEHYHEQGTGYYGAGHIKAFPQSRRDIYNFATVLRQNHTGALFFAKYFTMLVYPVEAEEWFFIDARFARAAQYEELRFVLRTPVSPHSEKDTFAIAAPSTVPVSPANNFGSILSAPTTASELQQQNIAVDLTTSPIQMSLEDETSKQILKSWFESLCPGAGRDSGPVRYLLYYPECERGEHDVLYRYLTTVTTVTEAKVYSYHEEGEWKLFYENTKRGVVLLHPSINKYQKIPYFRKVLLNRSINIYRLHLSDEGRTNGEFAKKLFPSGTAVLILDSLVKRAPENVLSLFKWYRHCVIPIKSPGSWKLVVPPQFKTWLKGIIRQGSGDNIDKYIGIFEAYLKIVDAEDPLDPYETPLEDSPLISPYALAGYQAEVGTTGTEIEMLKKNECLQVDWFAAWSLTQVHRHRRYIVVYDLTLPEIEHQAREWVKSYQHIMTMPFSGLSSLEHVEQHLASHDAKMAKKREHNTAELAIRSDVE